MQRPPPRTRRPAGARERAGPRGLPGFLGLALDALARSRAQSTAPLDAQVGQLLASLRAGARDRRLIGDLVFAWARRRSAIEPRLGATVDGRGGLRLPVRDRDTVSLAVAARESDLPCADDIFGALSPELLELADAVMALPAPPSSLPPWLAARMLERGDADAEGLLRALSGRAPTVLAVDVRRLATADALAALQSAGMQATRSPVVPDAVRVEGRVALQRLEAMVRDALWPMDDGSQAVALALHPQAGDTILDVCAGGGGKTRLLTSRGARVVAMDLSGARLRDSVGARVPRLEADARHPPFAPGTFMKILVDAPCTGTGTLRRAPDLAHRINPTDVAQACQRQQEILVATAPLLAPGGLLIYATCSLLPEENEDVVTAVLQQRPELAGQPLAPLWGGSVASSTDTPWHHTFLPSRDGTDGFFVAALARSR